jgi:Sec-independent protein translocase protein TatA
MLEIGLIVAFVALLVLVPLRIPAMGDAIGRFLERRRGGGSAPPPPGEPHR